MITYLFPAANGILIQLTPVPAARANFQCLNNFPEYPPSQYVYVVNSTLEDHFIITSFLSSFTMIRIRSVEVIARAIMVQTLAPPTTGSAYVLVKPSGGGAYYSPEVLLNYTSSLQFSYPWLENPFTAENWTIADILALQIGIKLKSNSAGTQTRCFQLCLRINFDIAGALISNDQRVPSTSDTFHQSQGLSVYATLPSPVDIYKADPANTKIRFTYPNGIEDSINSIIVNGNALLCFIPAASLVAQNANGIMSFRPHAKIDNQYISGDIFSAKISSSLV